MLESEYMHPCIYMLASFIFWSNWANDEEMAGLAKCKRARAESLLCLLVTWAQPNYLGSLNSADKGNQFRDTEHNLDTN